MSMTEPDQQDADRLHDMVVHLADAAFVQRPALITTDRTGKVDGAWVPDGQGGLNRADMHSWLRTATDSTRDFTLSNLGGMLRMYAEHPHRNPLVSVTTYPDWPAMVEVRLYE